MRKSTVFLAAGLALVFAAIATFMVLKYIKTTTTAQDGQMVPVVVAVQDLTFGTGLEAHHMKVVEYPSTSLPKGYYSSPDSLMGEITKVFLMENEPIIANKLSSTGGGLSLLIPDSLRATSIKVDKVSGVSGFVLPGDRVDVVASFDRYGKDALPLATTILQYVEVLAAGEKTEKEGDKNIESQSVTLLVDGAGAQALGVASSSRAKLSLALRNPGDTTMLALEGLSQKELVEGKKKATRPQIVYRDRPVKTEPVKEEPKPVDNTVTVFKGGTEKTQTPPMVPGTGAEPPKTTPN